MRITDKPSRGDIDDNVERLKRDMRDKEDEMDIPTADIEMVRETRESLEGGTLDGADEVDRAMEEAEEVTETVFTERDDHLEQIQQENEEYEGDLQERSDTTVSDREKLSGAQTRIETNETQREMGEAIRATEQDLDFLIERKRTAVEGRDESDRVQEDLRNRVQQARSRRHER